MKLRLLKTLVAIASGVLLFTSCADFDIWPFTWFAVVPLLAVVLDWRTERPAFYGYVCGLVANGGGFYWFLPYIGKFGHLPLIASLPIFALLIGYQALVFGAFAWGIRRLYDRLGDGRFGIVFLAPLLYVSLELVVPFIFPWYLAITQAWVRPVIQIADLTGPLGISFLLMLSNAALYELYAALRNKSPLPSLRLGVAGALIAASLVYGQVRIHQVEASRAAAPKLKIGLVQANIGINEKWHEDLAARQLDMHQRMSMDLEARGAQLIVWPESSYPYMFRRDQAHDWPLNDGRRAQRGFHTPLLFGTLTAGFDKPYPFNSALLLDEGGNVRGTFDKNILIVFGEYVPYYEQMKWIKKWIPEVANWGRGTDVATFPLQLPSGTAYLGPMICYEDIFPSFGRRLAKKRPNLLVNITNDAWFGRTSEPYEHMALSVYRAVEMRLDLVRAVNTGVSAFIDSTGRVVQKGPSVDPDEQPEPPTTLLVEGAVQEASTLYATVGEWFGGLCMLLLVAAAIRARALAGRPIGWRLVAVGAGGLFGVIVVGVALLAGPSRLGLGLRLLAHVPAGDGLADVAFSTALWLLLAAAIGSAVSGALVARAARRRAPLESALATVAVLVVPALAFGTLEGEQAGLVLCALAGIGIAIFANRRVARRFAATP